MSFASPQRNGRNARYRASASHMRGKGSMRGFTLMEVMIALLVITLGIGAVINTTSESGWKSAQLKQKTLASWVAQNQIALYRAKRTWNNASSHSGQVVMANAVWIYQMKISATADPALRRIDVDVLLKGEDGVKASVTGFIGLL
ncbi:MAG: type II secretion system minor pseudopilin GspI [Gammaproteobacteria bacterium]|nr:type II secretion system minor pseudopilin GspI [Gammaproteobacteria bacterium]